MSTLTFHHHFRQVTAMSPLQYPKWLRLNEARLLMLAKKQDATTAAFQVGYGALPNSAASTVECSVHRRSAISLTCGRWPRQL